VIPYFEFPSIQLGPITIEVFGIFAALGVWAGSEMAARAARWDGLDERPMREYAVWGVAAGVVVGHLVHVLLYHPEELRDPWRILAVWAGLSSMGGLLGAVIAAGVFFRVRRVRFHDYADAFALAIAPGWGIARLGCFAVHDHPGVLTDFPLAVQFPGGPRHDLGFYDAIALFAIAAVVHGLRSRGVLRGRLLAVVALLYGTQRFFMDFLRASDVGYPDARYLGLTPAQYFCFGLWAYALWRFAAPRQREIPIADSAQTASNANPIVYEQCRPAVRRT
jgi:phosphatidylglycerol:prolipoprotein diacylglycerol transferase